MTRQGNSNKPNSHKKNNSNFNKKRAPFKKKKNFRKGKKKSPGKHVEVTINNQNNGQGRGQDRSRGRDSSSIQGHQSEVEIIKYGFVDESETETPIAYDKYELPPSIIEKDPFGDDLFSELTAEYIPSEVSEELWTFIRWGIPSKSSWFPESKNILKKGDKVIVDSEKGTFSGEVIKTTELRSDNGNKTPRKIVKTISEKDLIRIENHKKIAEKAFFFAKQRIEHHNLKMNLFNVHILHSGEKILFYFTSENRVDFRQLVRELAAKFSMRIEMRQMGVRDDAKVLGGLGPCGKALCCSTHLNRFIPVSIRMAKDQNLVLKPQNVSGQCSRLKCCLAYEEDVYKKLKKDLPKNGKRICTPKGIGKVIDINILKETVKVRLEIGEIISFTKDELKNSPPCKQNNNNQNNNTN